MEKKTVVITGSSSGFGFLTALAFAQQDFHVIATMRNITKSEALLAQAKASRCSDNIQILPLDITDSESIVNFVGSLTKVDILVNNAGFALAGCSEDISINEFKCQLETNFFGTVAITNAILPLMRNQRSGRIINVSSISGVVGFPGLSPYVASKHAIEGWSECLRLEMVRFGVWVSLIEPGSYKTNIWSGGTQVAQNAQSPESAYYSFYQNIEAYALKNQDSMGEPDEVAGKIVKIATVKQPRLRYPIGKGISLFIFLKRILPWNWWQAMVLKTFR